ncbi:MAG: septum formation initiator family protein [Anaeromassilibacillus sp.]|nr:septum formation initiator family protein [Anaeromassilibacillus sp.]MDY3779254.1 septum formation initiator family protein [Candidatus Limousia pullorum]
MAFEERNLAYDLSLFEDDDKKYTTVPQSTRKKTKSGANAAKKKPSAEKTEDKNAEKGQRKKYSPLKVLGSVIAGLFVVGALATIIMGQAQLTELNRSIEKKTEELKQKQSQYTQLDMNVRSRYSTAIVEEYAKDELGMSKATNYQKEFVNLSDGDKAEVLTEESQNIFSTIVDAVTGIWS